MAKRIGIVSDFHCGALFGLTPPLWHGTDRWAKVRRDLWAFYQQAVRKLAPVDVLVVNGDAVEGPSGVPNDHCISVDRVMQAEMAAEAIRLWNAPRLLMVMGTPFHTGQREDWEKLVGSFSKPKAERLAESLDVEAHGKIINFRHFTGGTSVPKKIPPGLTREQSWNRVKAEAGVAPKADIIVRSHLHTHMKGTEQYGDGKEVMFIITPGLQGYSSYGARKVSRVIHFGALVLEIEDDGRVTVEREMMAVKAPDGKVVRI